MILNLKILKTNIAAFILVLFVCPIAKAQTDKQILNLEPGKSAEQEIAAGQTQFYEIKAGGEQYLHIVIDQKTADVAAALFTAGGEKLMEIDNPNITRGPEQIFFITKTAGTYHLQVTAKETGRCGVKIEALRNVVPQDQKRIEAQRLFIEGEKLSAGSAHARALAKYTEALNLINNTGDSFDEATILYSLGVTEAALGGGEKAAEYFRRSLALFQTGGSWDEVFKDFSTLYLFMGGKQQAFDYLANALPLLRALKNQRLEAILLNGLARICEDMNQPQKALDLSGQALALYRITGKRGAEVFTLTEIADGDLSLEDKMKAVGYLEQALLLARGASDKSLEVSLLMGIGYIYASIDEHQKALNYFQRTLLLWRTLKDRNGEAYTLNFIGTTYFTLGSFFLARDYLQQSLVLFQEAGDVRAEARTLSFLGVFENRFGDAQKALDYFQKALKVFQETGDKNGEASTFGFLAETYWTKGDRQKALENYQKSLSIWQSIAFREGEATTLSNMGFVYDSLGDSQRALDCYNQALPVFRLLGNQSGEASALYGVARSMEAKGELDAALANIEAAINLIESIRTRIAGAELRTSYLATYQHLYQFYIDLLMRLNTERPSQGFDARALQASERARARGLLDVLSEAQADLRKDIEPALLERERALQKQLNTKDEEKRRAKTPREDEELDKEIRRLTADYQNLQAEINLKNPRYAALTKPQPANLKEIQQQLDAGTVLLEYALGEDRSFLWVVSQNSIKSFILPPRREIEDKARLFYEAVKTPSSEPQAGKAAAGLSRILIEPAESRLENKRLLVVADGVLQYVPFAALPVSNSKSENQSPKPEAQFLIENNEIVYMPSASALAPLRAEAKERKTAPGTIAVLADPVFDASDTRVRGGANDTAQLKSGSSEISGGSQLGQATREAGYKNSLSLPRLPGTRREAATILSLVPETEKKQAMDFDASRSAAVSPELAKYRIIHFATHGLLNSRHPELSGIVFSLVDEKGTPQDGFLRLHEIYNLRLPADLIVLSACQTALGKEIKGEGLIGLTRGFMYAGAQRVAASLWAVNDRATSELMKLFYQGMLGEKRLRPAAALREAQIEMIKNKRFAAPYYWSAFIIQGEWR